MAARSRALPAVATAAVAVVAVYPLLWGLAEEDPTEIVYLESWVDDDCTRVVVEDLVVPAGQEPTQRVFGTCHERGFLPRGALAPDGASVALVSQPKGVADREGAEAILVDLDGPDAGTVTTLPVPAFGLSTPAFGPAGDGLFVTSASQVDRLPRDGDMQSGRLAEYEFAIHQVRLSDLAVSTRLEQRLTYLHPIGFGKVRDDRGVEQDELLAYRIVHDHADIVSFDVLDPGPPGVRVLADLGFAMARSFHLSDSRRALIFSASSPGGIQGRIYTLNLPNGGAPEQRGGPVPREASPNWAGTSHNWFFSRAPDSRRGETETPPIRLFLATDRRPNGDPQPQLSALVGLAPAPEVAVEGGVSPGGRYVVVRAHTEEGPQHVLRDVVNPEGTRLLGEGLGSVIRVLGFR